ncbi:LysR substrate-binding domain-containing protein [Paenalcaligenes sp. Me52]|uniref:LysR substrate-binding domain-containing protein n=1 Tax=Paenalcaligenes sp. Me52 TaxID=3392038 RepID=UPI003D2DD6B0
MDSETLRIFTTVATELSITHAAAHLGRAPSNVTTRIQQLEADLGSELFVRTGKRLTLSAAGQTFLDYANKLLALEAEARHVVTGGLDGGTLRMGSMESTAASRLPALLANYHAKHTNTQLQLSTGPTRALIEQLRTGLLDCVFVALASSTDADVLLDELGLQAMPVWTEELLLLLPSSESAVMQVSEIQTRTLAAFPLGCTYRGIAEQILGMADTPEWRVLEIASYHAMIACVAAGNCVTLVPASVLKLAGVPENMPTLKVASVNTLLVWRKGYDVPAFRSFLALLAEALK